MSTRFPFMSDSPSSALSLLSSTAAPWASTPELSSRSSAALRELIAENRATTLFAKQLFTSPPCYNNPHQHQLPFQIPVPVADGCDHLQDSGNHLTLDLMMQMPASSVGFASGRNKSEEDDEECCEIWSSFGPHIV